jgi:hypothetical protein
MAHKKLLENLQVKRWYDNVSRASELTAEVDLRRLGLFCNRWHLTPLSLLDKQPQEIHSLLVDTVTELEKEGYAGSYLQGIVKGVKSWLSFNNISLGERKINFTDPDDTPTLREEKAPEPDELRKAFEHASPRTRAAMALAAFCGFRPGVLGNHKGTDGLQIRDLPEIQIDTEKMTVTFTQVPTMVIVRRRLSKAGFQYFGLLQDEGCRYLSEELERRLRLGHTLAPNSPVISHFDTKKEKHVTTKAISASIRLAFRTAGFNWRPYILRVYFSNRMLIAESKTKGFLRDYRAFFMGHRGDIEHAYTLNKCRLPETLEADMREAFSRAARFLDTVPKPEDESLRIEQLREILLLTAGYTEEELVNLDLAQMSTEDLRQMLKRKVPEERPADSVAHVNGDGTRRQRVLDAPEAAVLINSGSCEFVGNLPGGKVVVAELQQARRYADIIILSQETASSTKAESGTSSGCDRMAFRTASSAGKRIRAHDFRF